MNQDEPVGFWSYTRRDDEIERGKIKRLVNLISDEFEITTGKELRIFVDNQDISWGEEWRSRIDSAIMGTTFMIAIITPRFFKSQECRREVITFSSHASSLGLEDLLLPILYSGSIELLDEKPDDELATLIKRRQHVDWTSLRLEDEESPKYRQKVHQLAVRLAEILDRASEIEPTVQEQELATDDPEGIVEQLAEMEEALPGLAACLTGFSEVTEEIGSHMQWATDQIGKSDKNNGGFAGRLRVSRELAGLLQDPVQRFAELGDQYATGLAIVDPGILTLIRMTKDSELSEEDRTTVSELFGAVKSAAHSSRENVPILMGFSSNAEEIAKFSKSIRPLMRTLMTSVQRVIDGQSVMDEWERLIQEGEETPS